MKNKPFPFAIYPNALQKGLAEDLSPLTAKLNEGPKIVANETQDQSAARSFLKNIYTHIQNIAPPPPPYYGYHDKGDSTKLVKKSALTALHHRLKTMHGIEFTPDGSFRYISGPYAEQRDPKIRYEGIPITNPQPLGAGVIAPKHAERLIKDMPTLYALARLGGAFPTARRRDAMHAVNSQPTLPHKKITVQPKSTFFLEALKAPLGKILKRIFVHGSSSTGLIGAPEKIEPVSTQEATSRRMNAFDAGLYLGQPRKVKDYMSSAAGAFGLSPAMRLACMYGDGEIFRTNGRQDSYSDRLSPIMSRATNFTTAQQKKITEYVSDVMQNVYKFDPIFVKQTIKDFGPIYSYGDSYKYTENTLVGLIRRFEHYIERNHGYGETIHHLAPLAMSTIGYDGVEDPRRDHHVISVFPHGIPKVRSLAGHEYDYDDDRGDSFWRTFLMDYEPEQSGTYSSKPADFDTQLRYSSRSSDYREILEEMIEKLKDQLTKEPKKYILPRQNVSPNPDEPSAMLRPPPKYKIPKDFWTRNIRGIL